MLGFCLLADELGKFGELVKFGFCLWLMSLTILAFVFGSSFFEETSLAVWMSRHKQTSAENLFGGARKHRLHGFQKVYVKEAGGHIVQKWVEEVGAEGA